MIIYKKLMKLKKNNYKFRLKLRCKYNNLKK